MGNAATIYDEKCLDYTPDQLGNCPVYDEHLETMRFVTQTGKVLEKFVYQNYNVPQLPEKFRISWFQLIGKCIKNAGQALPEFDPFRTNIITTGRAEKLIGQMENEFTTVCNSLLLKPIQEIRLFHQTLLNESYQEFIKLLNQMKFEEKKALNGNLTESHLNSLENLRLELRNVHYALHSNVVRIYESVNQLKLKIPAVLEFQLEMNHYSTNYLEYLIESFQENKTVRSSIIPLKALHEEIHTTQSDYRSSILEMSKHDGTPRISKDLENQTLTNLDKLINDQPNENLSGDNEGSRQICSKHFNTLKSEKSKKSNKDNSKTLTPINLDKEIPTEILIKNSTGQELSSSRRIYNSENKSKDTFSKTSIEQKIDKSKKTSNGSKIEKTSLGTNSSKKLPKSESNTKSKSVKHSNDKNESREIVKTNSNSIKNENQKQKESNSEILKKKTEKPNSASIYN